MPQWIKDTMDEVARARAKFPGNKLCVTAFTEEHGEAVRAVLEHYYAPSPERLGDVRKELIQTIAMAVRLLEEGDPVHGLPANIVPTPEPNGNGWVPKLCWVRQAGDADWSGPYEIEQWDQEDSEFPFFRKGHGWWHEAKPYMEGVAP